MFVERTDAMFVGGKVAKPAVRTTGAHMSILSNPPRPLDLKTIRMTMTLDTLPSETIARARAHGKARLEALRAGSTPSDSDGAWAPAAAGPAFAIGTCWTQCTFYAVGDFEAEIGFYLDILGLRAFVLSQDEAMFTTATNEYYVGVKRASDDEPAVNGNSLRVQFMVADIAKVVGDLESRGINYEQRPEPFGEGSPLWFGTLRSPNGVRVDLWGMVE